MAPGAWRAAVRFVSSDPSTAIVSTSHRTVSWFSRMKASLLPSGEKVGPLSWKPAGGFVSRTTPLPSGRIRKIEAANSSPSKMNFVNAIALPSGE
jgi:hypothetical protein